MYEPVPTQVEMSVADWLEVPDCPIQRNTEVHANKARNRHLKTSSPTHCRVAAAMLPDGNTYKLDGHTRAFLWDEGALSPPSHVIVDFYDVEDIEDVKDLYRNFDNQYAVENGADRLYGAYRVNGIDPQSTLLRKGATLSSLKSLCRKQSFDICNEVKKFRNTLNIIDRCGFTPKPFPEGVLTAMIITVTRYGEEALPFWKRYFNDEGIKEGKSRDGVQALSELLADFKSKRNGFRRISAVDLCGKALSAYHLFQRGKPSRGGLKGIDPISYAEKHLNRLAPSRLL